MHWLGSRVEQTNKLANVTPTTLPSEKQEHQWSNRVKRWFPDYPRYWDNQRALFPKVLEGQNARDINLKQTIQEFSHSNVLQKHGDANIVVPLSE